MAAAIAAADVDVEVDTLGNTEELVDPALERGNAIFVPAAGPTAG